MSKVITKILGGSAEKIIGSVGNILDDVITTDEEREEAKARIQQIINEHDERAQEQVTARWEADMKSDNTLSKNIRPLTLIFLTAVFTLITFFDGNIGQFEINEAYKPIYQTLLITVYGAYFAGRSIEKIRVNKKQ